MKVSVRSLAGWNSAALMLGKAQWHSLQVAHQQLEVSFGKDCRLFSGPDHDGSCQWQWNLQLLGSSMTEAAGGLLFLPVGGILAKGILLGTRFSTLALSGSGAGFWHQAHGAVPWSWCPSAVAVMLGYQCLRVGMCTSSPRSQGLESLGLTSDSWPQDGEIQ